MAPAAKRKKAGADEQSPAAAPKSRQKRQKTTADPTDSIETPPPTPKPAATSKGRKPNTTSSRKVNGDHARINGAIEAETEDTSTADNASVVDSSTDAPAVRPPNSKTRRGIVKDGEEDGSDTRKPKNGISSKNMNGDLARHPNIPSAIVGKTVDRMIEDAAPAQQGPPVNDPKADLHAPDEPPLSPTVHFADPQMIQPTIEQPSIAEQARSKEKVKPKDREKRDKLYQHCLRTKPVGEIFSLTELRQANIATNEQELLNICQSLVTHFLFAAMTLNRGILYKTRSYDVAKKLAGVSENHILIYSLIENAGRAGMWMRPLELKSGIHTALVRKAVRELVSSKVVQEIKSAETSKKTYISADVKPDEKHIGGGFMDEGKFDEGMINILTYVVTQFLQDKGWAKQDIRISEHAQHDKTSAVKHKSKTLGHKASKVAGVDNTNDDLAHNATHPQREQRKLYPSWTFRGEALIPQHPSYYYSYPTAIDVMLEINEKKVIKDIVLTLKDTEQLLSKMEFDGYIERMRDAEGNLNMKEPRWRASRRTWKVDVRSESSQHFGPIEPDERAWLPGNGLSQVPCARCPVKMKCKPGGVINPEECKYLDEWLAF